MHHTTYVEVRTYELDSYNHVNNAVYLNYLEYARMDFLRAAGFDYLGLINEGYRLFVTKAELKYKFPAELYEKLAIDVSHIKLGKCSGTFLQIIKNEEGNICTEAKISWACVDKDGKPSKLPEKYLVHGLIPEKEI